MSPTINSVLLSTKICTTMSLKKSQNLMPEVMQNIDKSDESLLIFWGRFFLNRMMTSLSAKKRKWQVKHFCNVCIMNKSVQGFNKGYASHGVDCGANGCLGISVCLNT